MQASDNRKNQDNPNGPTPFLRKATKGDEANDLGQISTESQKPWEVWIDYATTDEEKLGGFKTIRNAMRWIEINGKDYAHADRLDIIKRLPDGTLTTEF